MIEDATRTTFQKYDLQKPSITIAAFNIQVFGDTKYGKKNVVEVLLKVRPTIPFVQLYELYVIKVTGTRTEWQSLYL